MSRAAGRLTEKHVLSLNEASEAIAAAANTIQRVNPQWGVGVVKLLILANDKVVAVMNDGAAAIARYIERHGIKEPDAPADGQAPLERPDLDHKSELGEV